MPIVNCRDTAYFLFPLFSCFLCLSFLLSLLLQYSAEEIISTTRTSMRTAITDDDNIDLISETGYLALISIRTGPVSSCNNHDIASSSSKKSSLPFRYSSSDNTQVHVSLRHVIGAVRGIL